jgi:hypothetical protein
MYRKSIVIHVISNLAQEGVNVIDHLIHRIACEMGKHQQRATNRDAYAQRNLTG